MSKERWKEIPGYEGHYEASTFGRARSVDRTIVLKDGIMPTRKVKGVMLLVRTGRGGYPVVQLHLNGGIATRKIATLVITTFRGAKPPGKECRHLDGDSWNSKLSNLKWGTPFQNIRDTIRHGTHANQYGRTQ